MCKAALVFAVTIPLLCASWCSASCCGSIPLYRKVQQKLDRVLGITRENLTGVQSAPRLLQGTGRGG